MAPPPYFDGHGVLFVKGVVPAPSQSWQFSFGYLPADHGWDLTAMSLSLIAQ